MPASAVSRVVNAASHPASATTSRTQAGRPRGPGAVTSHASGMSSTGPKASAKLREIATADTVSGNTDRPSGMSGGMPTRCQSCVPAAGP